MTAANNPLRCKFVTCTNTHINDFHDQRYLRSIHFRSLTTLLLTNHEIHHGILITFFTISFLESYELLACYYRRYPRSQT